MIVFYIVVNVSGFHSGPIEQIFTIGVGITVVGPGAAVVCPTVGVVKVEAGIEKEYVGDFQLLAFIYRYFADKLSGSRANVVEAFLIGNRCLVVIAYPIGVVVP